MITYKSTPNILLDGIDVENYFTSREKFDDIVYKVTDLIEEFTTEYYYRYRYYYAKNIITQSPFITQGMCVRTYSDDTIEKLVKAQKINGDMELTVEEDTINIINIISIAKECNYALFVEELSAFDVTKAVEEHKSRLKPISEQEPPLRKTTWQRWLEWLREPW